MMQISEGMEYKMCYLTWISNKLKGEKEYAFLLVPYDKIDNLQKKMVSMQDYNPADFGVIIENGIGKPTEAVFNRIKKEFYFTVE